MNNDPEQIDSLMDAGADLIEDQAHRAGIDKDLIKSTAMSNEQVHALEWFSLYSTDISAKDKPHLQAAVLRLLLGLRLLRDEVTSLQSKLRENQRASRSQSYLLAGVLCVALLLFGILRFNDLNITVDPNEGKVTAIESSWWGLVKKEREIKWMKTDDYDSPGWMTKDANGKWYLYISEDVFVEVQTP